MENFSESYSSSAFEDTPEYKEAILNFKESTYSIEKEIKKNRPPTDKFWGVTLSKTEPYKVQWVEETLTSKSWTVTHKNALIMPQQGMPYNSDHKETYYTDKSKYFPTSNIERRIRSMLNADRKRKKLPEISQNQPVLQYAKDGTIRDINWYIIVAANLKTYPRGTLVMTTLGPGRVYDTWKLEPGHFDIYTSRPRLDQIKKETKKS